MPVPRQFDFRNARAATTTAETMVAIAILGIAMAGVGRFVASVNQGLRERELSARIGCELINARERIGSWSPEEITKANIERLPVSEVLMGHLQEAHWKASVSAIEEPASALQVELTLVCKYQGQLATPDRLTFWVERMGGANE